MTGHPVLQPHSATTLGFFLRFTKYDSAPLKTTACSPHVSNNCCSLSPVAPDSQMLYSYCRFLRLFTNQALLSIRMFHVFLSSSVHPVGARCRKSNGFFFFWFFFFCNTHTAKALTTTTKKNKKKLFHVHVLGGTRSWRQIFYQGMEIIWVAELINKRKTN